ncbi:unnamed protein product, partial [Pylaiella littoralis]
GRRPLNIPILANPSTAESATWRDLGSHHKEDFLGRTRGHSPPTRGAHAICGRSPDGAGGVGEVPRRGLRFCLGPLPAGRDNGQCGDPGEGWCPSASSTHA